MNTVLGPIDAERMGGTMSHVHLTINILCWHFPPESPELRKLAASKLSLENIGQARRNALFFKDNLVQDDAALAIREVAEYKKAGGGTLVCVDLPGIGRNPGALQEISRATGVHIVASTGWYVGATHPPALAELSVGEIADGMVEEIEEGIGVTGVKAGNIGEIGLSGTPDVSFQPGEEKVLRASARAQKETGASLTIHPNAHLLIYPESAVDHWDTYIDVLEKEGADLGKCYMSHLGLYPDVEIPKRILNRGVGFVSYDHFGHEEYYEGIGPGRAFPRDKEE
ncbi:MAG: hypothetical protein ACRD1Z_09985, partial [Vicinamibacteria bacterium]